MAYNSRAPQGAHKKPARKVGGPSAKHRGYNPEAAAATGKKPRWSSEQRAAKGMSPDRPRGQREDRREGGRPDWQPRGKDARASVERAPAARKRDTGSGYRSYDDRPRRDDRSYGDRPQRSYDDRPRRSYDEDRPRRSFDNDRPRR